MKRLSQKDRLHQCDRPIIAITGGIGSGKTSFCSILRSFGLEIIDADALIKNIYQSQEIRDWLEVNSPQKVINSDHPINFKLLREIFFSNNFFKNQLEEILYSKLPAQFLSKCTMVSQTQKSILYDVPLLYEKKLETSVDLVVVVYCEYEIQIKRMMQRDHISRQLAENILGQQMSLKQKKDLADEVIWNNESLETLKENVKLFYLKYKDIL